MIKAVVDHKEFLELKGEWNNLLELSSEADNVFLRHEWFDVWWQAFGSGKEMLILVCHDEKGTIIGIAPLMIFRDSYKGLTYKRLGFIEDPNAPSMNFIIKEGEEEAVVPALLLYLMGHESRSWDVAVLNKISHASPTIGICKNVFYQEGIKYLLRDGQSSPYIPVNSDWETFLGSTSVRFRKQLRNKINKLNKAGQVNVVVWDNLGGDGKHLTDAMSVSSRSWKHDGGTSMIGTAERKKFFELLSKVGSGNGWLRIWLMNLDGKPVATEYHLEYKGRTHAMRGDFDKSQDSLSPGSVLEAHIIEHCFKNGLLEYDFCGLPYGYKMRWTDLVHERDNLLLYNNTYYSKLLFVVQKWLPLIRKNVASFARSALDKISWRKNAENSEPPETNRNCLEKERHI